MLLSLNKIISTPYSNLLLFISFIFPIIIYYISKAIIDYFQIVKLYDFPDNNRKNHNNPTLVIGGLITFIFFLLLLFFNLNFDNNFSSLILITSFFYFIGQYDDLFPIGGAIKLIIIFMLSLIFLTLFQEFTIYQISIDSNLVIRFEKLSILITSIFFVSFLFSLNLVDGRNGVFVSLIIIWLFANNFYINNYLFEFNNYLIIFLFVMLFLNINNKFFFGDSGVYLLSTYLFLISVINLKNGLIGFENIILWYYLPVLDAFRVGFYRITNNKSMFEPGHEHFQYLITSITKYEFLFYSFFVSIPIILDFIFPDLTYLLLLLSVSIYVILILRFNNK